MRSLSLFLSPFAFLLGLCFVTIIWGGVYLMAWLLAYVYADDVEKEAADIFPVVLVSTLGLIGFAILITDWVWFS